MLSLAMRKYLQGYSRSGWVGKRTGTTCPSLAWASMSEKFDDSSSLDLKDGECFLMQNADVRFY